MTPSCRTTCRPLLPVALSCCGSASGKGCLSSARHSVVASTSAKGNAYLHAILKVEAVAVGVEGHVVPHH